MIKNTKIKTRMLSGFILLILLATTLMIFSLNRLNNSKSDFTNFVKNEYFYTITIKDCNIETANIARAIRDMLLAQGLEDYNIHKNQFFSSKEILDTKIKTLKEIPIYDKAIIDAYTLSVDKWTEHSNIILEELEKGDKQKATELIEQLCEPSLQEVIKTSSIVDEYAIQDASLKSDENIAQTNNIILICTISIILSIVFSMFLAITITSSIVRPIEEIKNAAIEMAKGNLEAEIRYESKDAVGQLAEAMRTSMAILHSYIIDIDNAMSEMADCNFDIMPSQPFIGDFKNIENSITKFIIRMSSLITKIKQATDGVSNGAIVVSESAQLLAENSNEQAKSVEELTASIIEINAQINETAKNSNKATNMATYSTSAVERSNEQMKTLLNAINDIHLKSSEISKIIKTIQDIAFQTNILALNAAIEAAKAGAAGAGFAVVADEVRNLANKSSEAAKNITALIEDSVFSIEKGVSLSNETASDLTNIVVGATETTKFIVKISKAANEQAELITHVKNSVEQISSVIQDNSSTSEESAATAEQLSSQSILMREIIENIKVKDIR